MYPAKRLVERLQRNQQPVAVVVGSALSVTRGEPNRGVPDVEDIVHLIRSKMNEENLLDSFNEALREGRQHQYQAAMGFVQSIQGPTAVDALVREAVLKARLPEAPLEFEDDGDPSDWHLPRGTAALGRLLVAGRFTGPTLTTNFDPLLSMAIEHAGGKVDRRVLDRDGHLPGPGDSNHGARVIHLHGYWRGSTLHLPQHISAPRLKLAGSLRDLLAKHTVLVVAYGGWHDAFMHALDQILEQPDAGEVLWCLYGDEPVARHNNAELLRRFEQHPRFIPYYGVDAHKLFDELASSIDAQKNRVAEINAGTDVAPTVGGDAVPSMASATSSMASNSSAQDDPGDDNAKPSSDASPTKPRRITLRDTTIFFDDRMRRAFPGERGVIYIADPGDAIRRLKILLAPPLVFGDLQTGRIMPIWEMTRGSLAVDDFSVDPNAGVVRLGRYRFVVRDLFGYRSVGHQWSFAILRWNPDVPTGLYPLHSQAQKDFLASKGLTRTEEYGVYGEQLVTRAIYDDGYIYQEGKSVPISAQLEIRHLDSGALALAGQFSVIHESKFDRERKSLLDELSSDKISIEDFARRIEELDPISIY